MVSTDEYSLESIVTKVSAEVYERVSNFIAELCFRCETIGAGCRKQLAEPIIVGWCNERVLLSPFDRSV